MELLRGSRFVGRQPRRTGFNRARARRGEGAWTVGSVGGDQAYGRAEDGQKSSEVRKELAVGLLARRHVVAAETVHVGKEANRIGHRQVGLVDLDTAGGHGLRSR